MTRLEQRGGSAFAFMAAALWIKPIDSQRQHGNLSSALRLFVLEFYRSQIPATEGREGLREIAA